MKIPNPNSQIPNNPQDPNSKQVNKWALASIAGEMGFIIALPLLVLALLGKNLDARFHTTPWLTLLGILLAIGSSTAWLTKRLKEYIK